MVMNVKNVRYVRYTKCKDGISLHNIDAYNESQEPYQLLISNMQMSPHFIRKLITLTNKGNYRPIIVAHT